MTSFGFSKEEILELVMEERKKELFAEWGHRWFDLVRTDRAITVLNAKKDQLRLVKVISATDLLFPIPQSQIDINRTKITQNPGY